MALAPGFRFHPTDEELVRYYLRRKVCGRPFRVDAISDIDVYKVEPWDLPGLSRLRTRDLEWYFFSVLDKQHGNGCRTNRATEKGYWKTTGKDRTVYHRTQTVGMKKTLVYHIGRAPKGERTNWVMHEYRLVDQELEKAGILQDAFVLCRIFHKSGSGPKNGEKYGAPFIEEEWEDDETIFIPKQEGCIAELPADMDSYLDADEIAQGTILTKKMVKELRSVSQEAECLTVHFGLPFEVGEIERGMENLRGMNRELVNRAWRLEFSARVFTRLLELVAQYDPDSFVLCRIFQKSGLGPPNGDRYAPFLEEEWTDDTALMIPGGEADDDMTNGDETRAEGNDIVQETSAKKILDQTEDPQTIPFVCKRERSEDRVLNGEPELETFSLFHIKRSKVSDPNCSNANGSEDSTTTSQDPRRELLEFPLLESIEAKECHPPTVLPSFDAATLEKSVPPGYLKFINNLENEILNVSMEKETLKIEVMRAQAMIDILQSRVEALSKENGGFRTSG